jgi:3-oxoacyl-[acyl-carrier protein] reductase
MSRPIALDTGVGRTVGIAAGIVDRLAADGWDIAMTYWSAYDDRMPWGGAPEDVAAIESSARAHGGRASIPEFSTRALKASIATSP